MLYQLDYVPIFATTLKFARAEGADAVIRLQSQLLNMHDLEILDWSWSNCILGNARQKIENVMDYCAKGRQ